MKKFIRNIKNAVWYDDVEVLVRNTTSNSEEAVTVQQLQALARTAKDPNKYPTMFAMLWKRITHYKHHTHIAKALYVLDYLVRLKPPSADVQRRLIDDILQPSQFTDLRLLANLRERAAFPMLSKIKRQAQDLLNWLMQMRSLDASKLNPIPAEGFDLPEPAPEDDNSGDRFQNTGFQQPPGNNSLDIFDLLAESLADNSNNNNNNGNNNNSFNGSNHSGNGFGNNGMAQFEAFDPFGDITFTEAPSNPNNGLRTKICDFCEFENDFDAVICANCGCDFTAVNDVNWDDAFPEMVDNDNNNDNDDFITCPKCGAKNPPGSKFCCGCGCDVYAAINANVGSNGSLQGQSQPVRQREIRGWCCAWCSILNPTTRSSCQRCSKEKIASGHANAMKYQMASKKSASADDAAIWQCTCLNVNEGSAFYCRVCGLDYANHVHSTKDIQPGHNDHRVRNKDAFVNKQQQQQREEMLKSDPNYGGVRVGLHGMSPNPGQSTLGRQAANQASQTQQQQQQQQTQSPHLLNPHDATVKAHIQQHQQNQNQTHTPRPGVPQAVTVQMVDEDFAEPIIVQQPFKQSQTQSNYSSTISAKPELPTKKPVQQQQDDDPFFDLIGFTNSDPVTLSPKPEPLQPPVQQQPQQQPLQQQQPQQQQPQQQQQQAQKQPLQQPSTQPQNQKPQSAAVDIFDIFDLASPSAATTVTTDTRGQSTTTLDFLSMDGPRDSVVSPTNGNQDLFDLLETTVPPSQQLHKPLNKPSPPQTQSAVLLSITPTAGVTPITVPSTPQANAAAIASPATNNISVTAAKSPSPQDFIGRPQTSRPSTAGVGGASSFLNTIEKGQSYRKKVRMEILATENSYIDQLTTLRDCFITPLRGAAISMKISSQALVAILTDVDPLIAVHQQFQAAMIKSREDSIGLAHLFSSAAQFMTVYKEYVANYPKTLSTIEQLVKDNKEFAKFHAASSADPRMASRPLSSFYIAPVQRLPRYVLLLKELKHAYSKTIKQAEEIFTNPSSLSEHSQIDEDLIAIQMNPEVLHAMQSEIEEIDFAIEVMNNAAILVNEYQKEVEGCIRLEAIHTKLGKKHAALQLKEPQKTSRTLVREDTTFKQDKAGKLREMTTVLCNDAIFWITPNGSDFKGGMNLLHLAFRTSSANTFYNDRWNIQFKEIPTTPTGEYYIDFRCHDNCFDNHGGITPTSSKKGPTFDNQLYITTLSGNMFGAARPQSATITAQQQEQYQKEQREAAALAQIDPKVVEHLAIDKPHSITFFRLVFPSGESMNQYAKLLCDLVDQVRTISTIGFTQSRLRAGSAVAPDALSATSSARPGSAIQPPPASITAPPSSTILPPPYSATDFGVPPTTAARVSSASARPPSAFTPPTATSDLSSSGPSEPIASPTAPRKSVVAPATQANPLAFAPSAAPTFVFKPQPKPEPKKQAEDPFAAKPASSQFEEVPTRSRPTSAIQPPPGFKMPPRPNEKDPLTPPGMALPAIPPGAAAPTAPTAPAPEPPKGPVGLPGLGPNSGAGPRGLVMPARKQSVVTTTTPAVNPFAKPTIG